MDERLKERAKANGFGTVKRVIHQATILHDGWEMDNRAWIVEMESGEVVALTTSHGGLYRWTRAEAEEKLAETEGSAASIRKALELWPNVQGEGRGASVACGASLSTAVLAV